MGFKAIAEDAPVLPVGKYRARFDRVEPSVEPGVYGDYLDWYWIALTDDGPMEIMGRSSLPEKFTRSTKGRLWYEAMLGRTLAKGDDMDWDTLKGTPCVLTVEVKKNEKGIESDRTTDIKRACGAARWCPRRTRAPWPRAAAARPRTRPTGRSRRGSGSRRARCASRPREAISLASDASRLARATPASFMRPSR